MTLSRLIIIALLAFVFSGTIQITNSLAGDESTAAKEASVNIDETTPLDVLIPLAEAGDATAQLFMGRRYSKGIGIEHSSAKAFEWYMKAAEGGNSNAQCCVGYFYQEGLFVEQNQSEAKKWFRRAAEQGHEPAKQALQTADPMLLLLAASVPVFFFLGIIYWLDTRKEPLSLLLSCLFFGGLAFVPIVVIETLLLPSNFIGQSAYSVACDMALVALTEEIWKFLVLFWIIWKHKEFDQYYDGIVYAVYVSLGFALVENILYVLEHGREVAVGRAMLSIPLHCGCGVIMGYYFALAKFGLKGAVKWYLGASILLPVLVHGVYNSILLYRDTMADSLESSIAVGLGGFFTFLMIYLWCTGSRRITAMAERDQNALLGTRSPEQERLFAIAIQQRNLLSGLCFGLLYIPFMFCLFAFLRDFLPDSSEDVHVSTQLFFFTVPYWAYIFWMSQVIYRTTVALHMSRYVFSVFVAFFFTLPFLNLIILLWLIGQATQTLKAAGYQVGWLGVDLEKFYH